MKVGLSIYTRRGVEQMKVLALDFETRIGKTIHGPTFRDPANDLFTQIWATNPEWVSVSHALSGFKRTLEPKLVEALFYTDIIVGHNISFDLCYIWCNKNIQEFVTKGGRIWDTQLAEYLLTGQQHTTSSLAELQEKWLGEKVKPTRIGLLFKKGIGADKILAAQTRCPRLFKLYDYYCHTDGSTPLKIFKAQYIKAKQLGMLPLIEMYNDYLLAIINMTCTGVHIDVSKAEDLRSEFTLKHLQYLKDAQDILKSVWTNPKLPEFNINSPDHKSAVLFGGSIKTVENNQDGYYKNGNPRFRKQEVYIDVQGYNVPTTLSRAGSKDGLYSTDKKVMDLIGIDPTTPQEVKEYCKLQRLSMKYKKAAETYCAAFIERSVAGILYPHFNSTVTPTGRLSSSEPNMQNIPSKGELAEAIMGLLIAPKGWICCSIDFSQLEKWVQALISQDATLISALENGICMHCLTLAKMEGQTYEDVYKWAKIDNDPIWDKKRTMIKPVGFLMDYGGMPKRVALETGLTLADVEEIYRINKDTYPDKHNFFENVLPEAVRKSQTFSLANNIAASRRKGVDAAQILGKVELLPIFDNLGKAQYNKQEFRHVGYWSTNYGKKYHFTDNGRISRQGQLQRNFSLPKFKNYPNQGGGADIQGATTAELLKVLLTKSDKVRMINEIHDSKLFYIREDCIKPVIEWLQETIENVPKIFKRRFNVDIPFKFPVEVKIGPNFGQMEKYNV